MTSIFCKSLVVVRPRSSSSLSCIAALHTLTRPLSSPSVRHYSSFDPMRQQAPPSRSQQSQQQSPQPPTDFITSTAPPKRSAGSTSSGSAKKPAAPAANKEQTLPFVGVQLSNEQVLRAVIDQSSVPTLLVAVIGSDSGSMQFLTFLEQLAESKYAQRLRVVSVDVDALPEFADMLRIESVPTIVAMVNGKQVATFGPVPPPELEKFLNKLVELGPPTDEQLDSMQAIDAAFSLLATKKFDQATKKFVELNSTVSGDPNLQTIVVAGLLRCAVALDNRNDAQELYEYVRGATSSSGGAAAAVENTKRKALPPQRAHIDKRIVGALEAFELYDLRNKLDRANDDAMHQQFATALDQWSLGHVDECLKLLLDLVRKDKKWREELAKQTFVKVCNILQADNDERHAAARRSLTNTLFL